MKIYEFITNVDSDKKELDFDLTDDLVFFMRSDPTFYRKKFYPVINKFTSRCNSDNVPSPAFFKNIVADGYKIYKEKYQVEGLEEDLSIDVLKEICKKIHKEEFESYKKEKKKD